MAYFRFISFLIAFVSMQSISYALLTEADFRIATEYERQSNTFYPVDLFILEAGSGHSEDDSFADILIQFNAPIQHMQGGWISYNLRIEKDGVLIGRPLCETVKIKDAFANGNPTYRIRLPNNEEVEPGKYTAQAYVTAYYCGYFSPAYLYGNIVTKEFEVGNGNKLDLSVLSVNVETGLGADNSPVLYPNEDVKVNVKIAAKNIQGHEGESTVVRLSVGSFVKDVQMNLMSIPENGIDIPFLVKLPPADVGANLLKAEINPGLVVPENNDFNNRVEQKVHLLCSVERMTGKTVPDLKQYDEEWKKDQHAWSVYKEGPLVGQPRPMSSAGCQVSAISNTFNFYGITKTVDGEPLTPGSLNQGLKAQNFYSLMGPAFAIYNGFSVGNDVQQNGAVHYARKSLINQCDDGIADLGYCTSAAYSAVSYKKSEDWKSLITKEKQQEIEHEICDGNPIIIKIPSTRAFHYVLAHAIAVDKDGNYRFKVKDPGNPDNPDVKYSEVRGFRKFVPKADPSMVFFHVLGNVDVKVIDASGAEAFHDSSVNASYSNIPGGRLGIKNLIEDPVTGEIVNEGEVVFENTDARAEQYRIVVSSDMNEFYRITQYSFDTTGTINKIFDISGSILAGQSVENTFQHEVEPLRTYYGSIRDLKMFLAGQGKGKVAQILGRIIDPKKDWLTMPKMFFLKINSYEIILEEKDFTEIKSRYGSKYMVNLPKEDIKLSIDGQTGRFDLLFRGEKFAINQKVKVLLQMDDLVADKYIKTRKLGSGR